VRDAGALEPVGLGAFEEAVYEAVLAHPASTAPDLADVVGVGLRRVRTALLALERSGLVSQSAGAPRRFLPTPPDVGLEALVLERQEQLERVRVVARHLMTPFRAAQQRSSAAEVVELLTSVDGVVQRFSQLQRRATSEVLILDTPPYRAADPPPVNDAELDALGRGVTYRVIYDRAALDAMAPGALDEIGGYVAAGEQARFIPSLPLKLAIVDREAAVVPLTNDQSAMERCLVMHPCSFLDALLYLFESLWERAQPIATAAISGSAEGRPNEGISAEDRELLVLLAAGLKDEAIAHQLGHSHRTIRRRIAALMQTLGIDTRFQAGVVAAKRGWL
jgi:DNA-binding CsgD family transcriptional regulator